MHYRKNRNPRRSTQQILRLLRADGRPGAQALSRSALHRLLQQHGLSRVAGTAGQPEERRSFAAEFAGTIWYGDVMHGPRVPVKGQVRKTYLVSLFDDASRLAAGRCQLLTRRTREARQFFSRALDVNPRIPVQKELGWMQLEEGNLQIAISLLSDHLDRHGAGFEAYNLLLKCYYLSAHYDVAEGLARQVMEQRSPNPCFENNRFICRLLADEFEAADLQQAVAGARDNPFLAYNLAVATETPRSWAVTSGPTLRDKLVFQEFRFGVPGKTNTISIRVPGRTEAQTSAPLVSIGSWAKNDFALEDSTVSRRHALIANFANDVWLYDLHSARGIRLDGDAVTGRAFLDGVHRIMLGRVEIVVGARADLLV